MNKKESVVQRVDDVWPSFLPSQSQWYSRPSYFMDVTERWRGVVKFDKERACKMLEYFEKDINVDREAKNPNLAAMAKSVERGHFLDSSVTIRIVVSPGTTKISYIDGHRVGGKANRKTRRGRRPKRNDGQHCLILVAKNDFKRDFYFNVQIVETDSDAEFRALMLASEFKNRRTPMENAVTALNKNSDFPDIPKNNCNLIANGYHLYRKEFELDKSDPTAKNKIHNMLHIMKEYSLVRELNKLIGSYGGSDPRIHLQSTNPMALLVWLFKCHHKDLVKFGTAIGTGEGAKSGDAAFAYRDFLVHGPREANILAGQKLSRHAFEVRAGMYAYYLWRSKRTNVTRRHIDAFMEGDGHEMPKPLEESLKKWEANDSMPFYFCVPKAKKSAPKSELSIVEPQTKAAY